MLPITIQTPQVWGTVAIHQIRMRTTIITHIPEKGDETPITIMVPQITTISHMVVLLIPLTVLVEDTEDTDTMEDTTIITLSGLSNWEGKGEDRECQGKHIGAELVEGI